MVSAPPKVAEKPVRVDPDRLSFKEKLALHRTLEDQTSSAVNPLLHPSSSREGYRRPTTPELAVTRPAEQATSSTDDDTSKGVAGYNVLSVHNHTFSFI